MCGKIFSIGVVAVAVIMGLLAIFLPPEHSDYFFVVAKFIDVMIPILAVGALLKFICRCPKCAVKCNCCKTDGNSGAKCS